MKKEKSLQKLTDIEDLNSIKDVENYLVENPDSKKQLRKSLLNRLGENYLDKSGKEFVLVEMLTSVLDDQNKKDEIRNITYEYNHTLITSFIHNYVLENRCFPVMTHIQTETKLSRQTIYNHLKNGISDKRNTLVKGKNEIMAMQALQKLYLIGIEDRNASALKHFIQLSGVANSNTANVNNYIQINNLKISNEDFDKLPKQDILEIECIVSKALEQTK
ncbi:hypothetical protein [Psychroserpens burtonensis]|uniref:hypothetical protein n=1 Tax=Psychroserpens burtonensis TaxID=49278 RepID=UPI00041F9632|nr:hypothetical protein [Psychroserpens burtonensis]